MIFIVLKGQVVVYSSAVGTAILTLVSIVVVLVLNGRIPRSVGLFNGVVIARIADTSAVMIIIPILLGLTNMLYSWVVIALVLASETLLLNLLLQLLLLLLVVS